MEEKHPGISIDHCFIDSYIEFLVSQKLIFYDYSDYLIDLKERHLIPVFLCPLTSRGKEVFMTLNKEKIFTENIYLDNAVNLSHQKFMQLKKYKKQYHDNMLQYISC